MRPRPEMEMSVIATAFSKITGLRRAFFYAAGMCLACALVAGPFPSAVSAETVAAGAGEAGERPSAAVEKGEDAAPPETAGGDRKVNGPETDVGANPGTPETAAARAEAEHNEKRERERRELMREAEQFIESADETLLNKLPYPLDMLFGVRLFGITLWRYLAGAGILSLGLFLIYVVSWRFKKIRLRFEAEAGGADEPRRVPQAFDVAILAFRNPVKLLLIGLVVRGVSSLMPTSRHPDFVWFSNMLTFLAGVLYFYDLVGIINQAFGDRIFRGSDRLMDTVRPILLKLVRFFILFVAALHIYQSLTGQTMFSLLAGLGIGGLALALASQETLQNLLGFAALAFDKSFLVGDAVTIGSNSGTVERVGLRSTHLRGYDGNRIVIPNSTAIGSNIVNLTRRPFVRREIRLSLSPANPYDRIVAAMEGIREVVGEHEGKVAGLPPVVRFVDYEPARFIIQVFFWYDSNQPFFFDECSRVNLEVCRKLSELGVLFAER